MRRQGTPATRKMTGTWPYDKQATEQEQQQKKQGDVENGKNRGDAPQENYPEAAIRIATTRQWRNKGWGKNSEGKEEDNSYAEKLKEEERENERQESEAGRNEKRE